MLLYVCVCVCVCACVCANQPYLCELLLYLFPDIHILIRTPHLVHTANLLV